MERERIHMYRQKVWQTINALRNEMTEEKKKGI